MPIKIQKRRKECKTIEDIVLANVGMSRSEFLNPQKQYFIKDIDKAAIILKDAGKLGKPITVIGDYDADGICAASILTLLFRKTLW